MIPAILAIALHRGTQPPNPNILRSLKRIEAPEFVPDNLGGGKWSSFQRCYSSKIDAKKVVKAIDQTLDQELWTRTHEHFWYGPWAFVWRGKPGTVFEGWCIAVEPGMQRPEILEYSDLVGIGRKGTGWTSLTISAEAQLENIPSTRELMRYTLGID